MAETTEQPNPLRERFLDHAVSAGFNRGAVEESLERKEEMEGRWAPYHHEIANRGPNHGHYVDVNKDETDTMVCVVSTERGIETVYKWK